MSTVLRPCIDVARDWSGAGLALVSGKIFRRTLSQLDPSEEQIVLVAVPGSRYYPPVRPSQRGDRESTRRNEGLAGLGRRPFGHFGVVRPADTYVLAPCPDRAVGGAARGGRRDGAGGGEAADRGGAGVIGTAGEGTGESAGN